MRLSELRRMSSLYYRDQDILNSSIKFLIMRQIELDISHLVSFHVSNTIYISVRQSCISIEEEIHETK
jgi:hypothetical protein